MELATNVLADDLGQTALVGGVNVLVVGRNLESAVGPLLLDELETTGDLLLLVLVEDAGLEEGLGECNRALDVGSVHALVVLERLVELVHPAVRGW